MLSRRPERDRSGADPRDLRRPETLLAADSFETILAKLPPGAAVLDVGGVTHSFVDMARRGFVVHVESIHLPTGEGRIPDDLRIDLSPDDVSHQAVFVPGLFFFLPKSAATRLIEEMRRVLTPGGLGLAAFPPLWNPSLAAEALIDAATPDGPDADIIRRDGTSVRYTRYTSREIEALAKPFSGQHLVTQKNGVRRLVVRRSA